MTPEQTHTLMLIIAIVGLPFCGAVVALLVLEYKTLTDKVPDNHITAVIRLAFARQPGVFWILAVVGALALGYLGAHFFWVSG